MNVVQRQGKVRDNQLIDYLYIIVLKERENIF